MLIRIDERNSGDIKIILARHAKADHNIYNGEGTFAGYRVDSRLTEQGISEIPAVAEDVLKLGGCDFIIHSNQIRSKETGNIVREHLENSVSKIELIEAEELHEIDVGDFTGKTADWACENYPKQFSAFSEGKIHEWDFPGGEDYPKIVDRIRKLFVKVKDIASPARNVLLVGHGMFNRVILNYYFPDHCELWQPGLYPHDRVVTFNLAHN